MEHLNTEVKRDRLAHYSQQDQIVMSKVESKELTEQQIMELVREMMKGGSRLKIVNQAKQSRLGYTGPRRDRSHSISN